MLLIENGIRKSNGTLRGEDVEAYLQAIEKEVYCTRILISISGGTRVAAMMLNEWKHRNPQECFVSIFSGQNVWRE